MTISTFQFERIGANPYLLDVPTTGGPTGSGIVIPQFKLGTIAHGDSEAQWCYVRITLGATTNLLPGQLFWVDDDYNATLMTTASSPRGNKVMVSQVFAPATIAGTYYAWLARRGQIPVAYTTLTINNLTETTATAGASNSPAAPTVTSKLIQGLYFTKAPATFTGTVTLNSPVITVLGGVSTGSGPFLGATITGAGIPASTIIGAVNFGQQGVILSFTMMTAAGVTVNGTATGVGITITPSLLGEARVIEPFIDKTN